MRAPRIRHLTVIGVLALVTASAAACGADPLTPLPVQAVSAQPVASPAASPIVTAPTGTSPPAATRAPAPVVKPTPKRTTTKPKPAVTATSTCLGAVRYDLDLRNTVLDLHKSMCFHTGGVLRLQGIGPGLVEAGPSEMVSQNYEGGVVDVRFTRPGTATVTIPQEDQIHTITVVVRA